MINSYEIKKVDGKEVLYIYLNFDYEFSSIDFKNKYTSIEEYIKEFIKKNKIAFTGTMVSLVVGGILINNINLKDDIKQNYVTQTFFNNDYKITEVLEKKEDEVNENKSDEDLSYSEEIKNNVKVNEKVDIAYTDKKTVTQNNNYDYVQEYIEEPEIDNNIYVNVRRYNGEIINIELEEYIIGVVGAEMPASFNIEALKSQSVIARTYALKAISRGQTLTDNESTQSYKSNDQLRSIWGGSYDMYYDKVRSAVNSTKGEYLTYNGYYIEAVYHSTSNGTTEDSRNVWGNYYPYLVSVDSMYDSFNPSYEMDKFISYEELSNKLCFNINMDTNFDVLSITSGNRVESINIGGNIYSGVKLRNLLGLRSTDFEITKLDNGVNFKTKGYGHGVGLSQYGANGMAKAGYSYIDILKHYYTGVSINYL